MPLTFRRYYLIIFVQVLQFIDEITIYIVRDDHVRFIHSHLFQRWVEYDPKLRPQISLTVNKKSNSEVIQNREGLGIGLGGGETRKGLGEAQEGLNNSQGSSKAAELRLQIFYRPMRVRCTPAPSEVFN